METGALEYEVCLSRGNSDLHIVISRKSNKPGYEIGNLDAGIGLEHDGVVH